MKRNRKSDLYNTYRRLQRINNLRKTKVVTKINNNRDRERKFNGICPGNKSVREGT